MSTTTLVTSPRYKALALLCYSFMCIEILVAVLICVYREKLTLSDEQIDLNDFDSIFSSGRTHPAFAEFFKNKFEEIPFSQTNNFRHEGISYVLPEKPDLYGAILLTWYWMHKANDRYDIRYQSNTSYEKVAGNHKDILGFVDAIKMMS